MASLGEKSVCEEEKGRGLLSSVRVERHKQTQGEEE